MSFKRCTLVLLIQVSEVLSQDILLSTEGPGQTSIPHIVGDIREVSLQVTFLAATEKQKHFFIKLWPHLQALPTCKRQKARQGLADLSRSAVSIELDLIKN